MNVALLVLSLGVFWAICDTAARLARAEHASASASAPHRIWVDS
jgi:hypothetical protein